MLLRRTAAAAAQRSSWLPPWRTILPHVGPARPYSATTSTSSPHRQRRSRCRTPQVTDGSLTTTAAPRPFPDYSPPRPDSPADDALARRLAAALLASPSPGSLPPLPFIPLLRPLHLLLALPLLASHPNLTSLLVPLLLLFPSRPHPHPQLIQCFAIAAHLAVREPGTARAILVRALRFPSPHRHFVEQFIFTYKAFSSDPASFDLLLLCLPSAQLLRRLRQYGLSPSPESCNAVLSRLPLDEAIALFRELPDKNVCSHNILLKALLSAGRLKDARQHFDEMSSPPDVVTYGTMVHGYCDLGELENAVKLLDEMAAKGLESNATVYTSVIALLCNKGQVSDALRVVEDMTMHGVVLDAVVFTTVMSGFCSKGDLAAARRLFEEMQKRGLAADGVTYTALINGLCRAGELKEADRVLQEMVDKGLDVDVVTYTALIDGYCKRGNMVEAFRVHNEMVRRRVAPNVVTYTALSDGLCKQGDVRAANELLHEMCNKGLELNVYTYNSLINGLCKFGNLEQATRIMTEMEAAGLRPDVYTYTTLIDTLCKSGEFDRAHSMLQEM
ncbi:unnamed protein product [Triticum turgidum subsp. durum]|nr:unnamed protein product [Triticum turgidum subsp. durum]